MNYSNDYPYSFKEIFEESRKYKGIFEVFSRANHNRRPLLPAHILVKEDRKIYHLRASTPIVPVFQWEIKEGFYDFEMVH